MEHVDKNWMRILCTWKQCTVLYRRYHMDGSFETKVYRGARMILGFEISSMCEPLI